MNDIISLKEKRHQRDLKYEKKMLRELSLTEINCAIEKFFGGIVQKGKRSMIEDGCIDFAIESYLLGAKYGRFGYLGESMQSANKRCQVEEKQLIDELYDFLLTWGKTDEKDISFDEVYFACEYFVQSLWKEGFTKGEKRYKLRLH